MESDEEGWLELFLLRMGCSEAWEPLGGERGAKVSGAAQPGTRHQHLLWPELGWPLVQELPGGEMRGSPSPRILSFRKAQGRC